MAKVNLINAINGLRKSVQAWCINNFVTKQQLVVEQSGAINFMNYCKMAGAQNAIIFDEVTNKDVTAIKVHPSVTEIHESTCANLSGLTAIEINEGCEVIGRRAFEGCSALTMVTLPSTLSGIGDYVFSGCTSLVSANIPANVEFSSAAQNMTGAYMFNNCTSLTTVTFDEEATYDAIPEGMFYGCSKLNFDTTLPSSVTTIKRNAYEGSGIKQFIDVGELVNIQDCAFQDCTSLNSVSIGVADTAKLSTVGQDVFKGCTSLESIIIPFIGSYRGDSARLGYLFDSSEGNSSVPASLKTVYVTATSAFPNSVFQGCSSLERIILDSSEDEIYLSSNMFNGCSSLTSVEASSVVMIPEGCFYNCTELLSAPTEDAQSIGANAFKNCTSIESIYLGEAAESIHETSFSCCSNVDYINVRSTNTKYSSTGNCLIEKSKNLLVRGCKTSVIPSTIKGLGVQSFDGITDLEILTIPSSVEYILGDCFTGTPIKIIHYDATTNDWVNIAKSESWAGGGNPIVFCTDAAILSSGDPAPKLAITAETRNLVGYTGNANDHIVIPQVIKQGNDYLVVDSIEGDSFFGKSNITAISFEKLSCPLQMKGGFTGCTGLKDVYAEDLDTWLKLVFWESVGSPLLYDANLHIGGKLLTDLVIPGNVSTVPGYAFDNCNSLESVVLSEGVVSTGELTFCNCDALESVTLPQSLTRVEWYSFASCPALQEIVVPSNVTTIANGAFHNCEQLKTVTLPASLEFLGGVCFADCPNLTTINYQGTKAQWYAITKFSDWDEGTGDYVVKCSDGDITVEPFSVTASNRSLIGYTGAANETLIIPESFVSDNQRYKVTAIQDRAFEDCSELVSITIPRTVDTIKTTAFMNTTKLAAINIEDGNETFKSADGVVYSNDETTLHFYPCGKADESLTLPEGLQSIDNRAFQSNDLLVSIVLPQTLTTISDEAFIGCKGLRSIDVPDSVTNIGDYAFYGCENLRHVGLPSSLTSIPIYMFSDCYRLEEIVLPETVTNIYRYAFMNCHSLKQIHLPEATQGISQHAFANCYMLQEIDLPKNLLTIDSNAFVNCYSLTNITIPTGPNMFGSNFIYVYSNAFRNCTSLRSVTIPASLQGIESNVFRGCSALETINFTGTQAQWESMSKAAGWDVDTGPYSVICSDNNIITSVSTPDIYAEEQPTTRDVLIDPDTPYVVTTLNYGDSVGVRGTVVDSYGTTLPFFRNITATSKKLCIMVSSKLETTLETEGLVGSAVTNEVVIKAGPSYNNLGTYKVRLLGSDPLPDPAITDLKVQSVVQAEKITEKI